MRVFVLLTNPLIDFSSFAEFTGKWLNQTRDVNRSASTLRRARFCVTAAVLVLLPVLR